MGNAIWIYPWDLVDLGLAKVSEELHGLGFDTLSLATVYHAGRFLQARSPRRRAYFPEDGTVYFLPDARIWQGHRVQPLVSQLAQGQDILAKAIEARDAGGMAVSCWTVCLHNSALGFAHPDLVTRNAFGDGNFYNLCPANPQVVSYAVNLVRDISQNYAPNRIELESPNFLGFAHEYHHEKDLVGLPPEGDFLLSLCFCPHCEARGQDERLDVPGIRERVRGMIDQICASPVPTRLLPAFDTEGLDAFDIDPELRRYMALREGTVSELLQQLRAETAPSVALSLIDGPQGWLGGCDHQAIAEMGIELLLCSYGQSQGEAEQLLAAARALPGEAGGQIGLRLHPADFPSREALVTRLAALRGAGASGVNIYNYGLVPEARLHWLKGAL